MATQSSILSLHGKQRSLLFARLAGIAYQELAHATKSAKKLGFTSVKIYDNGGAQAYKFMNKHDVVIACRGTEPSEFNDIKADLKAYPVKSETVGRVHRGFKEEVDDIWPLVQVDIQSIKKRKLWFCGHSLGAGMATIMASRCLYLEELADPEELYTFGSPRVGWSKYVNHLGVKHQRWVNNNDIVTRVPFAIIGYRHDGNEHYLNNKGQLRVHTLCQGIKDRFRGLRDSIKRREIDSFADHSIDQYIKHIKCHVECSRLKNPSS